MGGHKNVLSNKEVKREEKVLGKRGFCTISWRGGGGL